MGETQKKEVINQNVKATTLNTIFSLKAKEDVGWGRESQLWEVTGKSTVNRNKIVVH